MRTSPSAKRYAILIGINAYPDSPMMGSVRDVQEIKKCLESMAPAPHIQTFTASTAAQPSARLLDENPQHWPTYSNVVSSIKEIASVARPGDLLYIHYSGHGTTTLPTMLSPDKDSSDLALVLLEIKDQISIRYLRGLELAHLLKVLVEKGIIVTLVLDCCFSGSAVRKDDFVRYIEYDPSIDEAYPSSVLKTEMSSPATRSASLRPNWLVNPDGYTILTACGPTETAKELMIQKTERHGALSYFLVRTFKKLDGVGGRQQFIYHHLRARFRASGQKQTPMFYGNHRLWFFSKNGSDVVPVPIPLIRKAGGRIVLDAGEAHEISTHDRFAISPLGPDEGVDKLDVQQPAAIATVTRVGPLTSDVEISGMTSNDVESGWLATPLTNYALRKYVIRFEAPGFGASVLKTWRSALHDQLSLQFSQDNRREHPYSFCIVSQNGGSYQIRDHNDQQLVELPVTGQDHEADLKYVLDVMLHIARFTLVKDIATPASPFQNAFVVQLQDSKGKLFQPGCIYDGRFRANCTHPECVIEVQNGERLHLTVENNTNSPLYTHVYNLGHNWETENILRANHEVIAPKGFNQHATGKWTRRLKMAVSPEEVIEQGRQNYEDIIKLFFTVQPTSFSYLELPELATSSKVDRKFGRVERPDNVPEDWAAVNFRIRTVINEG